MRLWMIHRDAVGRSNPAMRVARSSISDSVSRTQREDLSGPAVCRFWRLPWENRGQPPRLDDLVLFAVSCVKLSDSARIRFNPDHRRGWYGIGPSRPTPGKLPKQSPIV